MAEAEVKAEEKARRPSWAELDAKDKRDRMRLSRQMLKQLRALLTNTDGIARLRSISDEEWAAVAEGDDDPRDWGVVVDNLPDVGKLVHLAMRLDSFDEDQIRGQLTKMRRRFYEQELTIQARRVGCPGRSGLLRNGPLLSELNEMSVRDAASIVNTYNYDLAAAIAAIRSETPTANRHVYASRLKGWEAKRNQWKSAQINQYAEGTARSLAQAHFVEFNRIEGYAVLQPTTAVCPVCRGWIKRGKVPMKVAMNNPPPYHVNCAHSWSTRPDRATEAECRAMWVGQ